MILDNEEQRKLALEILHVTQVPGQALDIVYALKQSIKAAPVLTPEQQQALLSAEGKPPLRSVES